jgi:hypothetical protein
MGGKATDTGSGMYSSGLTPYAQNLFGPSADNTTSGPTGIQKLGQQIMQASNNYSAQQGGPTEQAIAGIGNALVNRFNQPGSTDHAVPTLFGGPTPTFTPPIMPTASGNPFAPGTPMPLFRPTLSTPVQTSSPLQSFSPANQVPKLFG